MALLDNIRSVAKYESKLLMRSWFYRIFLILAILFLCFFNFAYLVNSDNVQYWIMRAIPSNIPYLNLLLLNTGQAVIAVFLSSEFLKSDKKLDTSEVFYVHPLSNAEYVIGKIWGNLNVFIRLNLIIIALIVVFNFVSEVSIDWVSYITYFLIISIPTLIYIFGLSVGLMLILKNQAITFVVLLGYIALTLFYVGEKFYYLLDYMMYNLPLVKSSIVGFSNWPALINHRLIYLSIGFGFLCISIFLFRRLPNTKYGRYRWLAGACCFILIGIFSGFKHVNTIIQASNKRAMYTQINNKYVDTPQMNIEKYDINVEQHPNTISATASIHGTAQESSSVFTFTLNPALQIRDIKEDGKDLSFSREQQIILIDFGRILAKEDTVTFVITYNGKVDENFCYLDIPADLLQEKYTVEQFFNIDKKYSFQTENYVLFTPETYWYPRSGVAYSSDNPDWQHAYFSNYRLTVKTINGLQALSQGTRKQPVEKTPAIRSNEFDINDETMRQMGGNRRGGDGMFFIGGGPMGGGGFGGMMPGGGQGGGNFRGQGGPGQAGGNFRGQGGPGQGGGDFRGQVQGGDSIRRFRGSQDGGDFRAQGGRDSLRRFREGGDSIRRFRGSQDGGDFRAQGGRDSIRRFRGGEDSLRRMREELANNSSEITQDSIFIFETDFPTPAISLIIGDYEQKCIEVDYTLFNVWNLKGNDYFSSTFEGVLDTLPYTIRLRRQALESQYALNYSFKRFSLVEVPVQFSSYARTWTQAQEVMQPEMILLPEKGCTFFNADIIRQVRNQKRYAKMQGLELSDRDAALRFFSGFLMNFQRAEGMGERTVERGVMSISSRPNPFFIFPQLYNYRYNIVSSDWSIANRMIELYLQNKGDNNRMRQMNGISNNEKANLLIQKYPFKELLTDPEQRDLLESIVSLKTNVLFAPAERNIGNTEFREALRTYLNDNKFSNIRFEDLLNEMSSIAGEDLSAPIANWDAPTNLPVYIVGAPEFTYIINRDVEVYVTKLQITNDSEYDGIVNVETLFGGFGSSDDPRAKRKISLNPHETKSLVTVWDEAPRAINVNTLISGNLPNLINMPLNNMIREQNVPIPVEGDFILANVSYDIPGEVIVDNEDNRLFELSQPDIVGLLPQWMDQVSDNSFPYSGVQNWRPPLQWTLTTNDKYYGSHIRSAYVIKSGSGSQTATWKIPVPVKGTYDLFYYVFQPDELRRQQQQGNNRGRSPGSMEYQFKVHYSGGIDKAYIDLRRAGEGWYRVGTYIFEADTIRVVLGNNVNGIRMVTADAVKIVKRETSFDAELRRDLEMSRVEGN